MKPHPPHVTFRRLAAGCAQKGQLCPVAGPQLWGKPPVPWQTPLTHLPLAQVTGNGQVAFGHNGDEVRQQSDLFVLIALRGVTAQHRALMLRPNGFGVSTQNAREGHTRSSAQAVQAEQVEF